jgi:CRP-like cAMP-binding protein
MALSNVAEAQLAQVELFAGLSPDALSRLTQAVDSLTVPSGTVVVREGDESDALYVVAEGHFQVYTQSADGGVSSTLQVLGPGDAFGEMGLITLEPRSAYVKAHGDGALLRLDRARFLEILAREPALQRSLGSLLSHRLRAASHAIAQRDQTLILGLARTLGDLPFGRWRHALEASVLEPVTERALRVCFGPDADSVAQDLVVLGVVFDQPTTALTLLREYLEHVVGRETVELQARERARRLAEASCWDEALALFARYGPEEQFRLTAEAAQAARAGR